MTHQQPTRSVPAVLPDLDSNFVRRLLHDGCALLGLPVGILARISGDDYEILEAVADQSPLTRGQVLSLAQTYCEHTIRAMTPVGFHRAARTEWKRHPAYTSYGIEAYLGARVVVRDEVFGTLNFSSRTPRSAPFTDAEVTAVRLMAQWVGYEIERRATERALSASEVTQRALLEAIPDMILRQDRDGVFLSCKPARDFEPFVPPSAFIGRPVEEVLPPSVAARDLKAISRALAAGTVEVLEYQLPRGDTVRDYEARIVPTGPNQVVTLIRDVTERKRFEVALLERDRRLERLLDAALQLNAEPSLELVLQKVADSARVIIGCRYAALGVLDARGEELANFAFSGLSPEEAERLGELPRGRGVLGLLIRDPRPLRMADISAHPSSVGFPPNHPHMRSFLGVPVVGREGPIGNLYCTEKEGGREFTEEDENIALMLAAEAAVAFDNARLLTNLHRLHRSRDRFYAMVNHELRNAITAVYGWSELIARKAGAGAPRAVHETLASAEYARELLNDLLDLSRLDADKIEPTVTVVDALGVVEEAIATVEPEAQEAKVTFEVRPTRGPVRCHTDEKRVRQILVNLLRNAVRHSPEGSAVTIGLAADDSTVTLVVEDRGEGISVEQQAIIFDAYARANSKAGGGTGLGLTLSRRLAELLGGTIRVESQLGHGATFTVSVARHLGS